MQKYLIGVVKYGLNVNMEKQQIMKIKRELKKKKNVFGATSENFLEDILYALRKIMAASWRIIVII